jgi:hypothetical protein
MKHYRRKLSRKEWAGIPEFSIAFLIANLSLLDILDFPFSFRQTVE